MNKFCVKCGHQLEVDSSFCSNCGTVVNSASTPDMGASSSTQNTTPVSSTTTYEYNPYISNNSSMSTNQMTPKKKNNNRLIIIGAIVAVICVVIVGGVFAMYYMNSADVNTSGGVSQSWTDAYIYGDLQFGLENGKDYVEATIGNDGRGGNVVIYATAKQDGKIYTQSQTLYFNSGEKRTVRFVFSETDVDYDVDYRMWIAE